jgi:hypothetical protein
MSAGMSSSLYGAVGIKPVAAGALTFVGVGAALLGMGWAIAAGHATAVFVFIAILGLAALSVTQRGVLIGVLVIAAMNGVPFLDTSQVVTSKLTVGDFAILALVLSTLLWLGLDNAYRPSGIARTLTWAAIPLLFWWAITFVRSVTGEHVATSHAVAFGRDFLYFGLLLLLLPRIRLEGRDLTRLIATLGVAACVFTIGQISVATGLGHVDGLIHFQYTVEQAGLTRVYANMTDLVTAVLAIAIAASMLARRRPAHAVALPAVLLLTTSVAVQLTRARWGGLLLGLLLVSPWFIAHGDRMSALARRRLVAAMAALAVALVMSLVFVPGTLAGSSFTQRGFSLVSDLTTGGGTIAVREAAAKTATGYLGGQWPVGIGFVPPGSHYFEGLPEGSIRDSDLGVLGAIMTMGLIGAALIYVPVVLMLIHCMRRAGRRTRYAWLRYGGAVWLTATLISSATLVTLFSASGLTLTAAFLAILASRDLSGQ